MADTYRKGQGNQTSRKMVPQDDTIEFLRSIAIREVIIDPELEEFLGSRKRNRRRRK